MGFPKPREAVLALLTLVAVGLVAYWPHIAHGGFYSDDWADIAATLYPPEGGDFHTTLDFYSHLFPYRPGLILYVPLKYWVLGANTGLQLAWAVCLAAIVAALLYAVLRLFSVPWFHAWPIAALTIVFPWSDSTKFWEAASLPSLAIAIALVGLLVALAALDRRSLWLHLLAAALYAVSILTYEITLPLIAGFGLLYVLRAGWVRARGRWGIDLLVVVAAGLWNAAHTNRAVSTIGGDLEHLGEIISGGGTIVGRTLWPVGAHSHTTPMLLILLAVFAAGTGAYLWDRQRWNVEGDWGLPRWLALGAAGLVVAVLGWAMFIPADPYYTPSVLGSTNRVNAIACLGVVILVYAAIGTGVTLAAELFKPGRRVASAAIVALALMLGAAYVHTLERHSDIWNAAYDNEVLVAEKIQQRFPDLSPEQTLFVGGTAAFQTLGVPIFEAPWSLNGMVKERFENGDLTAYAAAALPVQELVCEPTGVALTGSEPMPTGPYGSALLFNAATGQSARPRDRAACRRVIAEFAAGPAVLASGY
ncbi:MAG: hypothetical protein ABW065_00460 [Solirubrobacterales bacterium]